MKKIILSIVSIIIVSSAYATDSVKVKSPQLPILIDREDNILFYLRIDAQSNKSLQSITIDFDKKTNTSQIESLKLYYSGTEAATRLNNTLYYPAEYISRDTPGKTLAANASYSLLCREVKQISAKSIRLSCVQPLVKGVNYFWVSIKVKPNTSILSKIEAKVSSVILDQTQAPIEFVANNPVRLLGIGVRHAGDDGVNAYRIPGLVTTKKGTLLGVYDVRYNNSADLQEHVDIGISRSVNGGQSWEKMIIAMSMGESGSMPKAQNGVGDPAILVDHVTGTIWIVAAWTHGMGNQRAWFNSQSGIDKNRTAQLMMVRSDDDGKTWSKPINVTPQVKDPSWKFLLQGPGCGITMSDGTLVFPTQFIDSTNVPNAAIMYSKDRGTTWQMHNLARTNTTEAQVVEVEPGVLMLNMRDNRGGSRAVATTRDMGKTWTEHPSSRSVLQEPVCMASLIKVAGEDNISGRDILFFSNPNTTKGRHSITIKASLDGGLTFPENQSILLDSGNGWGYTCLTMIDRETVGILYEGSTAHMIFQAIKLKDIIR